MQDVFPLARSELEGVEFDVPIESDKILREEYGAKALTATRFHWYEGFLDVIVTQTLTAIGTSSIVHHKSGSSNKDREKCGNHYYVIR